MRFDCPLSRTLIRATAAALLLFAIGALAGSVRVSAAAQQHAEAPQPAAKGAAHEGAKQSGEAHHEAGWLPTIAKAFNFAVLVAILVYFLRAPLASYLSSRIARVREDLVTAAATREEATRRLAEIDAKLEALPGELETLKHRGAEEIAAERVRIEQAAEAERQRLLEHTRREIDMRLRIARRDLIELAASLTVGIATERIKRSITPADQVRLVDQFQSQVEGARQ